MSKIRKTVIFLTIAFIFLISSFLVQAAEYTLNDNQNDVFYQDGSNVQTDLDTQPNTDILYVKYETDENTVSISIKVVGSIQESTSQVLYYGEYTSADAIYQFTFSNNNLNAMVEAGGSKLPEEATVQVNNDILTITFDLATQDTSLEDLYAYAHFYEDPNELMMGAKYIDTTADIDNEDPSN